MKNEWETVRKGGMRSVIDSKKGRDGRRKEGRRGGVEIGGKIVLEEGRKEGLEEGRGKGGREGMLCEGRVRGSEGERKEEKESP